MALLTAGVLGMTAAYAADKGAFDLGTTADTASWSGQFLVGAFGVAVPVPEACTPETCDVLELDVDLGSGTWSDPGGMLVAIQWPRIDSGYDLDLFVYGPGGDLVASSEVWTFSRNEAAWIEEPVNGKYRVVVMPKIVWSLPAPAADAIGAPEAGPLLYDGFVEFERGITVEREELNNELAYTKRFVAFDRTFEAPTEELLPDLVPTKPQNFHVQTTWGAQFYFFGDRGLRHQPSCYPQEMTGLNADDPHVDEHTATDAPLRCLRWDQGEHNFGDGPFELHMYTDEYGLQTDTEVYQRIYRTDGSVRQTTVGAARYNENHGHFHYLGFQRIELRERNDTDGDGTPGEVVATGINKGICMVDIENNRFGDTEENTAALGYPVFDTCDTASHRDPNDPTFPDRNYFQMGISVGYADVYPWFIADQYLDVTNAADGEYILEVTQDAGGRIEETRTDNNTVCACVNLQGEDATGFECNECPNPSRRL